MNRNLLVIAVVAVALVAIRLVEWPRAGPDESRGNFGAEQATRAVEGILARAFPEGEYLSLSVEPQDDAARPGTDDLQRWEVQALDRGGGMVARAVLDADSGTLLYFAAMPSCHTRGDGVQRADRQHMVATARTWLATLGMGGSDAAWVATGPAERVGLEWRVSFRSREQSACVMFDSDGHFARAEPSDLFVPHPSRPPGPSAR